jgi:hypothetical protein
MVSKNLREDQHQSNKSSLLWNLLEEEATHKFSSLPIAEHGKKLRWRPREGRLPNRQHHTTLDLI